jgi:3-oxoadipate enol-lactonase/4-carboxymuconolactone decarboxylase
MDGTLNATLNHRVEGPPDAPALVLGASLGTTLALWEPLLPELTRTHRVIRFDHRGHGGSPASAGPYAIAELGADLVALLDRLEIDRTSYCGVSLGGMIGMWLAVHAPARIERLALVCTSAFLPPAEAWRSRAATVRARGMDEVASAVVARWFTASFASSHPRVVAQMTRALRDVDPEAYASCCEAIASWDFRSQLRDIRAPTLVIAGGEDAVADSAHAYAIGAGIPGARVAVVERAAHIAAVEQPEAVAALVLRHLSPASSEGRTDSMADDERARRGEVVRRAVLGDAHVDRARAGATAFSAPFQDLVNRFPWGDLWTRPGLSLRERSIVTLTVLAALHHDRELAMHVVAALRNGLTAEQIREVLLHVGAYAGIPATNRALAVAEQALDQAGALDGEEGSRPDT